MKRSFTLQSVICICMLSIFVSCHKRGDFEVPCKLLKMSYVERGAFPHPQPDYSGTITYNSWGDPTQIIWTMPTTGRPNYFFTYDNKRRLTWFHGLYNASVFDQVTHYVYQGDKIVGDTSWYSGAELANFRTHAWVWDINQYTYDSKGRIIRVDARSSFGHTYTQTYTYDAAGNLIKDGVTYDDKKNFLRTNSWLMLVTRNFSMNNYQAADAYNKKGLPLSYQNTTINFMNAFLNEFEYSCDHKNH
jgi:hypothetical protein